ncbi:protein kinase family protein [Streptomyces sp. SGAir0957]
MEPTASSTALAIAALDALGLDGPPKHISGRKGAHTWKADEWMIKTAVPGARGHLGHEATVYALLQQQRLHSGSIHQARAKDGQWLAVPWIDGRSVREIFAPAHKGQTTYEERFLMCQSARAALSALMHWHEAGWTHGDMQSENIIYTGTRATFIDFDNAHHPELPLTHPYRGGLVHVIAPELAAELLATGEEQHIPLTPEAELFALGASLYWAWTGERLTDYQGDPAGPHPQLYADIAAGRFRSLAADRPYADGELERLIRAAIRTDPRARSYNG